VSSTIQGQTVTRAPLPNRRSTQLETEAAARIGGLFERHGRMVYGVCRAMLRDVHEAEDAAQQVFLSAHKALLGRAHVRDPGGWLATIARNECRGRIAAGMRSPVPVADEDLAAIPSPVDEQARHDQALAFREALAALPERQREAVVLRYLYGLRYGEVAKALGLSRPATEALLFRARRGLRGRLRPVVGTALVVPLALREELALAIPGFSAAAGSSAATLGITSGVLAKLTAGPVGVKVAAAAVAVSTVGAVGTVESDRPARGEEGRSSVVTISTDELSSAASETTTRGHGSERHPESRQPGPVDRRGSGREHWRAMTRDYRARGRGESSPADDSSAASSVTRTQGAALRPARTRGGRRADGFERLGVRRFERR
jgi:RNA polymerase sigma-70 factor (ECF subfamily)